MSRARDTGFYFEPLEERLALVVEGQPFPSEADWAWIGDPIEMSADQARIECAIRWPDVDLDALFVELEAGLIGALAELEEAPEGPALEPAPAPDMSGLMSQAAELQRALEGFGDGVTPEQLRQLLEELELARASAAIKAAAKAAREREEQQAPPPAPAKKS